MSQKLYENLLAKFRKANKERRLTIAVENGFKTSEDYENYLTTQLSDSPSFNVAEITDMVIAFDTTGSMGSYIGNVKEHVTKLISIDKIYE